MSAATKRAMGRGGKAWPESVDELDGVTKAAILILTLESTVASKLLGRLEPEVVSALITGCGRRSSSRMSRRRPVVLKPSR